MKIKKITAQTMKEALRLVKEELGDDAIILKSRKVNRSGMFSFLTREMIEVTAAIDNDPIEAQTGSSDSQFKTRKRDGSTDLRDRYVLYDIREDVNKIEETLDEIGNQLKYDLIPGLPKELKQLYMTLVDNGVIKQIAGDLVGKAFSELEGDIFDNPAAAADSIEQYLREKFAVSGPPEITESAPAVMALIGPTGVGKTTTIAKIAAQYKFFSGKNVALISADTYRMAAIEQLRTFARISSLPLEVVYAPEDMPKAISKHSDKDLILIDTAGRSHRNKEKMKELAVFMETSNPTQIHLTLSASTKYADLLDIIDKFRIVPSDYVIFTKLDETSDYGNLLNLAITRPKPFSYLTLGQNVPDDIALADRALLAKLMLCRNFEEASILKEINIGSSAETKRARIV